MTTIALAIILGLVVVVGGLEIRRQRRKNRELLEKVNGFEQKISASVEERLVNHAKYCETVDTLVQKQLEVEEAKWRELLVAATCRIKGIMKKNTEEMTAQNEADQAALNQSLEKQMTNFQALLKQSYLDEYEKMRVNPPRPKKGPRKKIDPPQRYRSLDDEFNFCPTEEPDEK